MAASDTPLHPDHDPANFEGFTAFQLELYERFLNVAVEWPMQSGNLDGSGATPGPTAHITGVVSSEQLLRQYDLPVIITIPTGVETEARTTSADETTLSFSTSAWISDWDQPYGLIAAQIIIGNIVNNVESNRSLTDREGADPLATNARPVSTSYDFALNVQPNRHLKYGTADFEITTKRQLPGQRTGGSTVR